MLAMLAESTAVAMADSATSMMDLTGFSAITDADKACVETGTEE